MRDFKLQNFNPALEVFERYKSIQEKKLSERYLKTLGQFVYESACELHNSDHEPSNELLNGALMYLGDLIEISSKQGEIGPNELLRLASFDQGSLTLKQAIAFDVYIKLIHISKPK